MIHICNFHFNKVLLQKYIAPKKFWPKPDIIEAAAYGFAAGFFAFPFIFGAVPFFREYDIYQRILRFIFVNILGYSEQLPLILDWVSRLLPSLIVIFACIHGGMVVLTVMFLFVVIPAEAMLKVTSNKLFLNENSTRMGVQKVLKFQQVYREFRRVQIFIFAMDQAILEFSAALAGMGILAASSCGYTVLIMFSDKTFPTLMYVCAGAIFIICMSLNFALHLLASIPKKNVETFRTYWKLYVRIRYDKQCLQSCPVVGYSVGFLRNVGCQTALSIADTILNITATMALAKLNANK